MRKLSLVVLLGLFLMVSLTGCNMFRGAGKDVSNAGRSMEDAGK